MFNKIEIISIEKVDNKELSHHCLCYFNTYLLKFQRNIIFTKCSCNCFLNDDSARFTFVTTIKTAS